MTKKITLTKEKLQGEGPRVICGGTTTDKILNFYGWGDTDKPLKFVIVKGFVDDWCIYLESMDQNQSFKKIEESGNKISLECAKKLVNCDDEILERYRY